MSILYPSPLLNSSISFSCFCVESVEFSTYNIMSSAYNDNFTSSSLHAFYSFSSLIAVARTQNTVLNRSGESEHPCLVPDFSKKAFSFSPFSSILAVGLSKGLVNTECWVLLPECLIQQVWGGAQEFSFQTNSQVMLMLKQRNIL